MSSVTTETQTKARIFRIPTKISKPEIKSTELNEEQKELIIQKIENKENEINNNDDRNTKTEVYKRKIVWFNAIGFLIFHLAALYGGFLTLTQAKLLTTIWSKYHKYN